MPKVFVVEIAFGLKGLHALLHHSQTCKEKPSPILRSPNLALTRSPRRLLVRLHLFATGLYTCGAARRVEMV